MSMSDLALDLNQESPTFGDLLFQNGDLVLTPTDLYGIQQHLTQRLRVYFGEWYLNNTIGIPFFQQIFIKNPIQANVDALFQNSILQTPGVTALLSYTSNENNVARLLQISFSAQTTSGTVNYAGLTPT